MNKARPRILRIIARLNVGGPAVHCTLLSERLSEYGFDTVLVTGCPEEGEESYETAFRITPRNYRLVRLPRMKRSLSLLGDVTSFFKLLNVMRREKPDIVHTHTAKAGMLGRVAAFLCGVPVVVHTFHGHVLSGYFGPVFSKFIQLLERALARATTAIVTLSPTLKEQLSQQFKVAPEKQFRVIPLGRDLAPFFENSSLKGSLRKELSLSDSDVIIGMVGRLTAIKNPSLLLDGCRALGDSFKWHLVLAGEGPMMSELKQQARELGIGSRVHFLGWRNDLPRLYADFDVFTLTSNNEGTPLSIIEAFASGVPVVSSSVGGVPDMFHGAGDIRDEGILFPSGDREALTQAIRRLLTDENLRKTCGDAGKVAARNYSDEMLVKRTALLYQELLGTSRDELFATT